MNDLESNAIWSFVLLVESPVVARLRLRCTRPHKLHRSQKEGSQSYTGDSGGIESQANGDWEKTCDSKHECTYT